MSTSRFKHVTKHLNALEPGVYANRAEVYQRMISSKR
jgi:hypothetical protein